MGGVRDVCPFVCGSEVVGWPFCEQAPHAMEQEDLEATVCRERLLPLLSSSFAVCLGGTRPGVMWGMGASSQVLEVFES